MLANEAQVRAEWPAHSFLHVTLYSSGFQMTNTHYFCDLRASEKMLKWYAESVPRSIFNVCACFEKMMDLGV